MAAPRYHLGCGGTRLEGYINGDVRAGDAVDLVLDLSELQIEAASCFFSNAFFEHLRRDSRVPHLISARRALERGNGFICYLGMPDFYEIARLYLEHGPGTQGPVFDLYNVYRYTHGEPEAAHGYYLEQLHKSLFDRAEIERLLGEAGFRSHVVFSYVFPGEPVPVTLGFYATADRRTEPDLREGCREFLAPFDGTYLELQSLSFDRFRSRSAAAAWLSVSPIRRFLRRFARAASLRLARI